MDVTGPPFVPREGTPTPRSGGSFVRAEGAPTCRSGGPLVLREIEGRTDFLGAGKTRYLGVCPERLFHRRGDRRRGREGRTGGRESSGRTTGVAGGLSASGLFSSLYLAHITWVANVINRPGIRIITAMPIASPPSASALRKILPYKTPPTTMCAHPRPFSTGWSCQGDRTIRTPHTGHKTPNGAVTTGHPNMNAPMRNQFW